MLRKPVKLFIAVVVIVIQITISFGEGYALDPSVITLVVNPKQAEVYAGSGKIVIAVKAPGKNLTFQWELSGPGKLEGKGAARFYIPPTKIDQKSASAIVTVAVKEPSGQATIKSVTFTILPSPAQTATPSLAPTPTKKKGMSKGTKVALGAGTVAALGGGIAVLAGGDDSGSDERYTTPGVNVGGYLWYLGESQDSCEGVCASHGGYHEATRTYAGSDGTNENCVAVLTALGAPPDRDGVIQETDDSYMGCHVAYITPHHHWVRAATMTTPNWGLPARRRAYACVE